MALSPSEKAEISSRIGPLGVDDLSDLDALEEAVERLGSPALAALEVMRVRYAEMVSSPAVVAAAGDGSVSHAANLEPFRKMIAALVEDLRGSDGNATPAGAELLRSAGSLADPDQTITSVLYGARNARPG